MTTVNLYTTPRDSRSARMRAWLASRGIPFTDHNVLADPEALRRMIEVSGSRRVPIIQIGERILKGLDENELSSIFNEN